MGDTFKDPEVRAKAMEKSIATRRANAAAKKAAKDFVRPTAFAPRDPQIREVEAALQAAASAMPHLDQLFEVPEARRADVLDMKLAAMKATSGMKGLGKDTFVRRRAVSSDVTGDQRAYGKEGRPEQLKSLAVDANEPGKIVVYDENYQARAIPEQNFKAVLKTGKLTFVCNGCGGEHLKDIIDPRTNEVVDWVIDYDADACPALPKVMKIRCPECRKRGLNMVIYDQPPNDNKQAHFTDDDASFVTLFVESTDDPITAAKKRLTGKMSIHLAWVHQEEALLYGIDVARIREATMVGSSVNTALIR